MTSPSDPEPATTTGAPTLDPAIEVLLRRDEHGLLPAIVQEADGTVLTLAWMDAEALRRTLATGRSVFWSRSRQEYWMKGETSGNRQWVREVRLDCDGDALLLIVDADGPACHTGLRSCFDSHTLPITAAVRAGAPATTDAGAVHTS